MECRVGALTNSEVQAEWERAFDIRHKGLLLALSAALLAVLRLNYMQQPLISLATLLFLPAYLLFTLACRMGKKEQKNWRQLWWTGFLLDMAFVGYLVGTCGHLSSPFVLLYPLVMLGAALGGPGRRDFLLAGALGHFSYAGGVYAFTGNPGFYASPEFWAVGGLNGAIFLCATRVVRFLHSHLQEVRNLAEEIEQKNKRLEALAVSDGLTGLYNHRYFWERLAEEVARSGRHNRRLCLLMIDVDRFKVYNDTHGHLAGDGVLCQLAEILRNEVRQHDFVCRYGGEEFAVILPETDLAEGLAVAERVRGAVDDFAFHGRNTSPYGQVTVSIGVSVYPADAAGTRELVNCADNALYGAKRCGRNRIQAYGSLLANLQEQDKSAEELQDTLETLVAVIDGKDSYTGGHSRRVAEYVRQVALRMQMDERSIDGLTYGAFLHDIGKLEIDRQILNKPGPLNDAEKEIIKRHPLFGVNLLQEVLAFENIIPSIKYHHERYDGTGYPEGLRGKAIPLSARILAVADSYDAMRSTRPYRNAMSKQEAVQEIINCAGKQFDPEIVDLFLQVAEAAETNGRREAAAGRVVV